MNDIRNIYNKIGTRASVVLLALLVVSCSDTDEALLPVSSSTVPVDLLLQVSSAHDGGSTRITSAELTQNQDGYYRGISSITLIPFAADQTPLERFDFNVADATPYTATDSRHYLSQNQNLQLGTASFLCYGWPQGLSTTQPVGMTSTIDDDSPSSSTFSPTPIEDNAEASEATILNYLNDIATAGGWNNATGELGTMFDEFVNKKEAIYEPFAGSSKNINKLVLALKNKFNSVADATVKDAVQTAIGTGLSVTYPTDLPDGSAVIQWNGTAFEYVDVPNQYAYPLDLCYYANSPIQTSNSSQQTSYADNKAWSDILVDYSTGDVVTTSTRSVAITEPLRYGVGCLKVTIKADLNGFTGLRDNTDNPDDLLPLTNGSSEPSFPLKAIMIGGQNKQGYDLTPLYPFETHNSTDDPEYVIYDKNIAADQVSLGETASAPVYSLAFQTKGDKAVKLVLEFENNSDKSFQSESGIIYPETKFYMVAQILPQVGDDDYYQRVFTRDYITTANLTIASLAKAYNALPDLNSDKIRLFTVVEAGIKNWQTGWEDPHEWHNW